MIITVWLALALLSARALVVASRVFARRGGWEPRLEAAAGSVLYGVGAFGVWAVLS